jgi:hypothetical protein
MSYVDELNTIYQRFADRLVAGIRRRRDKTGIYAYAMAVIFSDASDDDLLQGLSIDAIFEKAHARQPRIQRSNLHSVLSQVDGLQVDEEGRGLVFSYNQRDRVVTVVDRQLLLYRKYRGGLWPWEGLIRETEAASRSE